MIIKDHCTYTDVDDHGEDLLELPDELGTTGGKSLNTPVEEEHQILQSFKSDDGETTCGDNLNDASDSHKFGDLTDAHRLGIDGVCGSMGVAEDAESADFSSAGLRRMEVIWVPCYPHPNSPQREDLHMSAAPPGK
jgi:hypothetical protein